MIKFKFKERTDIKPKYIVEFHRSLITEPIPITKVDYQNIIKTSIHAEFWFNELDNYQRDSFVLYSDQLIGDKTYIGGITIYRYEDKDKI